MAKSVKPKKAAVESLDDWLQRRVGGEASGAVQMSTRNADEMTPAARPIRPLVEDANEMVAFRTPIAMSAAEITVTITADEDDPTIRQFIDSLSESSARDDDRPQRNAPGAFETPMATTDEHWSPVPLPVSSPSSLDLSVRHSELTGTMSLPTWSPDRQLTSSGAGSPSDFYSRPMDDVAALVSMTFELTEVERKREQRKQALVYELQSQAVLARERQRLQLARRLDREESNELEMLRRSLTLGHASACWETPQQAQQNVVRAVSQCALSRPAASLHQPPTQPRPERPAPQSVRSMSPRRAQTCEAPEASESAVSHFVVALPTRDAEDEEEVAAAADGALRGGRSYRL